MLYEYKDDFDVLSADEAAEILRVGYNAIYEMLNTGKLKAYRNGRSWRIPRRAIRQFILDSANLGK